MQITLCVAFAKASKKKTKYMHKIEKCRDESQTARKALI